MLGFLLPILHEGGASSEVAEIERHLLNNVTETAAGAHFVTSYSDGAQVLLHSDRRTDGLLLESLIEVTPKSDLVPKIVRGLLAHRKKGWWWRTWYEHENLRDERVEAFSSLVWDGVHEYTYVARATTPGRFVVPPTKAEEMYNPETFGRSGTERVVVDM